MRDKDFNIIVFCGGVGTRLWPLSRQKHPKQFHPLIGNRTLVQNAVYNSLRPDFSWRRIFISTGEKYFSQVQEQLPDLPPENFILEPEMRDTAPAVAYAVMRVGERYPDDPVAILWQDHLVHKPILFRKILRQAVEIVASGEKPMVYLGVPPRYPSINLGYIEIGKTITKGNDWTVSGFKGFTEKPNLAKAKRFWKGGKHFWNPGYFVCKPEFLFQKFKEQRKAYDIYDKMEGIRQALGTDNEAAVVRKIFPSIGKEAIDYVIHEHMKPGEALVIWADFGWSDVGEWQALKEALEKNPRHNLVKGQCLSYDTEGCLIYSFTDRLVATVGLRDIIVVDTEDALLVCGVDQAPKVKKLVKMLKEKKLDKYL